MLRHPPAGVPSLQRPQYYEYKNQLGHPMPWERFISETKGPTWFHFYPLWMKKLVDGNCEAMIGRFHPEHSGTSLLDHACLYPSWQSSLGVHARREQALMFIPKTVMPSFNMEPMNYAFWRTIPSTLSSLCNNDLYMYHPRLPHRNSVFLSI